jgi:hypothetical protein
MDIGIEMGNMGNYYSVVHGDIYTCPIFQQWQQTPRKTISKPTLPAMAQIETRIGNVPVNRYPCLNSAKSVLCTVLLVAIGSGYNECESGSEISLTGRWVSEESSSKA